MTQTPVLSAKEIMQDEFEWSYSLYLWDRIE